MIVSPPSTLIMGSTTPSTAALARTASTALPPSRSTRTPVAAARGCEAATIPPVAIGTGRGAQVGSLILASPRPAWADLGTCIMCHGVLARRRRQARPRPWPVGEAPRHETPRRLAGTAPTIRARRRPRALGTGACPPEGPTRHGMAADHRGVHWL